MGKLLKKMSRTFIIRNVASFYRDEDYDLILKHLRKPFSTKRFEEVLSNIFRILALQQTNQNAWKDEFNYLRENEMLKVFNEDTEHFLDMYLMERLGFDHYTTHEINMDKVPKILRKTFDIKRPIMSSFDKSNS